MRISFSIITCLISTLFYPNLALSQNNITVVGTVISSDDGQPLEGVTIIVKNSNKATATDKGGKFTLLVNDAVFQQGSLLVNYVGYYRQEIRFYKKKELTVRLVKEIPTLNEVVVTNSYTKPKRKEEVTGSIVTVSAEQLQTSRPIESFDKMLEGLAAGVQVEQSTELGTPVKINIRGQNALTPLGGTNSQVLATSSQPLFIVDGVPIKEQRKGDEGIAFLANEQLLNPLAGLNPDDIETISILKDAAAAAIYGANASNGVIIITTKKGKAGKTRLNVGYNSGWAQPINQVKWLSGQQYYTLVKEMYLNDGRTPFDAELLAGASNINTPWFNLVNRYSSFQNADVELSGGNENTTFRISASYLNQASIQKGNDFKKAYFRLQLDHKVSNKFTISATLAPSLTTKNALNVYADVPIIPNAPAYNADGTFFKFSTLGVPNPLAVLAQNTNVHNGGSINGNIRFDYALRKNLRISTLFGIDALVNKLNTFDSPKNATGESKNGFAQIYDRQEFSWINSNTINWNTTINAKHRIEITAGTELQSQQTKLLRGAGTGFTYYRLNELSNAASQTAASSRQQVTSVSLYGQGVYNYWGKYILSASARYDAASIFGNDVNATLNNAIGFGWIVNKERFLQRTKWINLLHLKASYGTTGNSRIGSYAARGLYSFSNTGYNGNTAASIATAPNPNLGWEKSYKQNIGVEFGFLKKYNIVVEYYQSIIDDAISSIPIPVQNGFTTVLANIGKMRNRGVDASINAKLFTGKFTWTTTLNAGFNKNIVVEVKNKNSLLGPNTDGTILKEGVSTSAIWGFNFAGVDAATGRELYIDRAGKIVPVTALDRNLETGGTYLGDRLPKLQGGWINSFSYKGITLSINLVYSVGGKQLISNENENNGRNLSNRNQSVNLLDRWQKLGDITNIPLLSASSNPLVYTSSKYVYDNTFFRLSNASLAYTLPKKIVEKLKTSVSVFANATNLFYWYKQKSPAGRNGIREYRFNFPEAQTFTWGAKLYL